MANEVPELVERLRAMVSGDGAGIICNGRTTRQMANDILAAADFLTKAAPPVEGDLREAVFERDDVCNVEFGTVPDCDCPHEHWHVNGVCLDVHIEEDRSGHIILTLEDDPIELQISGVADIGEARAIGFAWAAKKLCLAYTPKALQQSRSTPGSGEVAADAMRLDICAEAIVLDVAELPDRTSPDDWPDAMLVTADELRAIIKEHAANLLPATSPVPVDASGAGAFAEGAAMQRLRSKLADPAWCMRMAELEGDHEIGAGCLHPEAPLPKLFARACEVVRHAPDCQGTGRGDEHCTCDAVAFLHDLHSHLFAKDALATPAPVAGNALDSGAIEALLDYHMKAAERCARFQASLELVGNDGLGSDVGTMRGFHERSVALLKTLQSHGQSAGKVVEPLDASREGRHDG